MVDESGGGDRGIPTALSWKSVFVGYFRGWALRGGICLMLLAGYCAYEVFDQGVFAQREVSASYNANGVRVARYEDDGPRLEARRSYKHPVDVGDRRGGEAVGHREATRFVVPEGGHRALVRDSSACPRSRMGSRLYGEARDLRGAYPRRKRRRARRARARCPRAWRLG